MHPNPAFRQDPTARNIAFARERGFGQLSINGAEGPLASHIPFLLNERGEMAELHLVRSTAIARALDGPAPGLITVSGPDSYISPDWYGDPEQVPTWNYIAVHLRGTLEPLPDTALKGVLARLSAAFEARLAPKPEWRMEKMPPEALARMMRMIRPFRFRVTSIDGTWKLNQNKPDAMRLSAARAVRSHGIGQETAVLAALMMGAGPEA